jgi:hypothetical protein
VAYAGEVQFGDRVTRKKRIVLCVLALATTLVVAAAVPLVSRARTIAERNARSMALQIIVRDILQEVGRVGALSEPIDSSILQRVHDIVEHPSCTYQHASGDSTRYRLVWDGRAILPQNSRTTPLVEEAGEVMTGGRGIGYADGHAEVVGN